MIAENKDGFIIIMGESRSNLQDDGKPNPKNDFEILRRLKNMAYKLIADEHFQEMKEIPLLEATLDIDAVLDEYKHKFISEFIIKDRVVVGVKLIA